MRPNISRELRLLSAHPHRFFEKEAEVDCCIVLAGAERRSTALSRVRLYHVREKSHEAKSHDIRTCHDGTRRSGEKTSFTRLRQLTFSVQNALMMIGSSPSPQPQPRPFKLRLATFLLLEPQVRKVLRLPLLAYLRSICSCLLVHDGAIRQTSGTCFYHSKTSEQQTSPILVHKLHSSSGPLLYLVVITPLGRSVISTILLVSSRQIPTSLSSCPVAIYS